MCRNLHNLVEGLSCSKPRSIDSSLSRPKAMARKQTHLGAGGRNLPNPRGCVFPQRTTLGGSMMPGTPSTTGNRKQVEQPREKEARAEAQPIWVRAACLRACDT